jgi:hypothetical protein
VRLTTKGTKVTKEFMKKDKRQRIKDKTVHFSLFIISLHVLRTRRGQNKCLLTTTLGKEEGWR